VSRPTHLAALVRPRPLIVRPPAADPRAGDFRPSRCRARIRIFYRERGQRPLVIGKTGTRVVSPRVSSPLVRSGAIRVRSSRSREIRPESCLAWRRRCPGWRSDRGRGGFFDEAPGDAVATSTRTCSRSCASATAGGESPFANETTRRPPFSWRALTRPRGSQRRDGMRGHAASQGPSGSNA
jgi:hypothetical protein